MGVGFKKFSFFHSLSDNESLYSKLELFCCKKKRKEKKKRDIIVLWLHPMLCEILLPEMNKQTNKQNVTAVAQHTVRGKTGSQTQPSGSVHSVEGS